MSGLIHLYTGDGKGKTTASLGLALRFAGHGKKVLIIQLCKGRDSGELHSLKKLPDIKVLRNSRDFGFWQSMTDDSKAALKAENDENLSFALRSAEMGDCDLLVLDEITSAYTNGALDRELCKKIVAEKPAGLELVLTGRNAPEFMLQAADYISEIKCIRHPYEKGISAREGAEF